MADTTPMDGLLAAAREVLGMELAYLAELRDTELVLREVDGDTTRSFSIQADVTIHADGTATLLLDGTHEYSLDLETGAVVRISAS